MLSAILLSDILWTILWAFALLTSISVADILIHDRDFADLDIGAISFLTCPVLWAIIIVWFF